MAERSYNEERATALLAQYRRTGDPQFRDRLIDELTPLVASIARRHAGREPVEDLESEGYVGLVLALDRYQPDRGARFSTFATHMIASQIRHYLRDRGHLIRQPAWLQELSGRVARAARELEQRLQRAPTVAELAAATNVTEEGIEELLTARQAAQVLRLEARASGDDEDDLVVDPEKIRSRDYVTLELPIEDRIALEAALERLKELERKVLYCFFFQDLNQSETARHLGISCNYAGHVLRNGLRHLRQKLAQERIHERRLLPAGEIPLLDGATGIYTRQQFERRLSEEVSRAQHYRLPLGVCCLRLSPDCVDGRLQRAVGVLRERTRRQDVVGRTADAEFGIILPNTGVISREVAGRLAEAVGAAVRTPVLHAAVVFPEAGRSGAVLYAAARDGARPLLEGRVVPALAPG